MNFAFWFITFFIILHDSQEYDVVEEERKRTEESVKERLLGITQLGKPQQRNTVVDSVNIMLLMTIPPWVKYDDMEVADSTVYACATNGELQDMGSISRSMNGIKSTEGPDGSMQLVIPYNLFGGIHIKYGNFVQHFIMNILGDKTGELRLGFSDGDVNIEVTADPPSKMVDKLNSNQCVVTVNSVNVTLSSPYSYITTDASIADNLPILNSLISKVKSLLTDYLNAHVINMEEKLKYVYLKSLANSGNWICLEKADREKIDSEYNTKPFRLNTDKFVNYCGKKIET